MNKIRIASRSSSLAIIQAQIVIRAIKENRPEIDFEVVEIKSKGDEEKQKPLWKISDLGFFSAAVEDAVRQKKADIAVHSYKDLPIGYDNDLITGAVLDRRFCQDCMVCRQPINLLEDLPKGARIGTSSLRRKAQILKLRPDILCEPIRGNVPTRINQVEKGLFDGTILAYAGIERLGLVENISFEFNPVEFIPSPAQGAIAVQARANDDEILKLLAEIDDSISRITSDTERLVLHKIKAGCHAPAGVFAQIIKENIIIYAFVSDENGAEFITRTVEGPVESAERIVEGLANELLKAGAAELLSNG